MLKQLLKDEVFHQDFESFIGELILPGRINSLAGLLLKLTAPGIPDIYQGAELSTDSLVDPDNRRPVDYRIRRRLLEKLQDSTPPEVVLQGMEAGLPKLWTVHQSLRLRRERPDCLLTVHLHTASLPGRAWTARTCRRLPAWRAGGSRRSTPGDGPGEAQKELTSLYPLVPGEHPDR